MLHDGPMFAFSNCRRAVAAMLNDELTPEEAALEIQFAIEDLQAELAG